MRYHVHAKRDSVPADAGSLLNKLKFIPFAEQKDLSPATAGI